MKNGLVEFANGTKCWFINGKRHRKDGPAIEWIDGGKEWWLNGKELTEEEFKQKIYKPPKLVNRFQALLME